MKPDSDKYIYLNRDIKVKICLLNNMQYILNHLQIDEEVSTLINTEIITDDFKALRMDYACNTKSGKIVNGEGETTIKDYINLCE